MTQPLDHALQTGDGGGPSRGRSERIRRKARELTRRAGIIEPRPKGGGTLASEPVLVFRGPWRSSLKIVDQDGSVIGLAHKARDEYYLRDSETRCKVRETVKPSRFKSAYAFSVVSADGSTIGTIMRHNATLHRLVKPGDAVDDPEAHFRMIATMAIMEDPHGREMGRLQFGLRRDVLAKRLPPHGLANRGRHLLDRFSCQRFYVEDERGHESARLTYLRPSFLSAVVAGFGDVGYVIEFAPGTSGRLRDMALAACVVVDNHIIQRRG